VNPGKSNQDEFRSLVAGYLASNWKQFLFPGLTLTILGLLAVIMPMISTLAIDIFVGFLFLTGGFSRAFFLFRREHRPGYWWSAAGAMLAMVVGLLLVVNPAQGVLSLTLLLMVLFLIEGLTQIFGAFDFRRHSSNWIWLLFSGIVDLVLFGLIFVGWPETATWAIGLLAGINLFTTGLALIMLAIAARDSAGSM
jgi:uncharacterized membrane protein HdeD (DUF308 family)